MFSKSSLFASLFVLGLSSQAYGHAAISPVLGVQGTPVRNDVQRPNKANFCGKTANLAAIDSTTPIPANADGSFSAMITNFNLLLDGSRKIKTAQVDATGTGTGTPVDATMTTNGDISPTDKSSEQLTIQMPAGTKCTGGASGNLCLVSLASVSGFGNCVVVQQGAAANGTAASSGTATNGTATAAAAPAAAPASTAAAAASGTGTVGDALGNIAGGIVGDIAGAAGDIENSLNVKTNGKSQKRAWSSRPHARAWM